VLIGALAVPLLSPTPALAAPSVEEVTETEFDSRTTAHAVQMPATVNVNDLLIVLFVNTGTSSVTTPTGWTQLTSTTAYSSNRFSVYYKKAVGDEDGATVNFVTSSICRAAAQVYRISSSSWHSTTPPEISTAATGSSNSPNPSALNPTAWGAEDTLWIAATGIGDDPGTDGYPTDYTNGEETQGQGGIMASECQVNSARRENTTASEDPGSFNLGGFSSDAWVAFTIAIRPAAVTPTVQFALATSSGAESVTPANLEVTLSSASVSTVTVDYAVTAGTATGGVDYTLAGGTLTFVPSDTSENIAITVVDDALVEGDETIEVTLSNPVNATLGTETVHTYTIEDNDVPTVQFALATSSGAESVTPANLEVTLSSASVSTVTVDYAVTADTATGGVDYTLAAGTLTFVPSDTSENIAITVADDALVEGDETIEVTLSNPVNATLGTKTVHTYTIEDNVVQPCSITIVKETDPDTDTTTQFDFTGELGSFNLTGNGDSKKFTDLAPGTYNITETVPACWNLTDISCNGDADVQIGHDACFDNDFDEGDDTVRITLSAGAGQSANCTFTDTKLAPVMTIDKDVVSDPVVEPGGEVTYQIAVVNTDNAAATGVFMWDGLPTGFTYASTDFISRTGGASRTSVSDPTPGDTTPLWGYWTIPSGGSVTIIFIADVGSDVGPGTYDNWAYAYGDCFDKIDDDPHVAHDADTPEDDPEPDEDVTIKAPPAPPVGGVGGEAYPVNKIAILAPWIAIAMASIAGSFIVVRRRRSVRLLRR